MADYENNSTQEECRQMKHIVGKEGTEFMVLQAYGDTYEVIARCPSREYAEAIVQAFDIMNNRQDERLSYGGR